MNRYLLLALSLLNLALFSGCVQTKPLVSHAHIGHALTTWHDTPGQEGLFTVAENELDIALHAAEQAAVSVQPIARPDVAARSGAPVQAQRHIEHALNALNPDRHPLGRGLGYGAIRALSGAIEHLEYAASSDDASENFISSVVNLVDDGDVVIQRMQEAERILEDVDANGRRGPAELAHAHALLTAAKFGSAVEQGESYPSPAAGAAGLTQIASQLEAMLERETNPDYQPVPRRYVLGLVRLPNGLWGFRLPRRDRPVGGYGYGY